MVFFIARIAAPLATCHRWKHQLNKHTRTELVLNDDPRLVAAVGTVVEHAVNRAGLPEEIQKQMASTAVETCRACFMPASGGQTGLKCVVEDFDDRIEVQIDQPTNGARGGALADKLREAIRSVDNVKYEPTATGSRITLTKYLKDPKK
jgi:hypothetical protein